MTDHREHLRALADALPADGSMTVPVAWLRELLQPEIVHSITPGWTRERLYAAPADLTMTVREVAEVLGKSPSAVHKLASRHRLPFTRLLSAGHSPVAGFPLLFRVGDVRRYLDGKCRAA